MTPVLSVEGLPFSGGLAGAVQLEPEGLRLWQPASLIIESSTPVPLETEAPFAWRGTGQDFHLYFLQLDPTAIEFKLIHFSAYGIALGSASELARQAQLVPESPEARLEQAIQIKMAELRRNPVKPKKARKLIRKTASVEISVEAARISTEMSSALASGDEARLRCALAKALILEGDNILLEPLGGGSPIALSPLENQMLQAIDILVGKVDARCKNEHKLEDVAGLLSLADIARLLAFKGGLQARELSDRAKAKAKECASFELQFESVIALFSSARNLESHMRATVPIRFDGDKLKGDAPLDYVRFTLRKDNCTTLNETHSTLGSSFRVIELVLDLEIREKDCDAPKSPPVAALIIDPGQDEESGSIRCGANDESFILFPGPFGFWRFNFTGFHVLELQEGVSEGGFAISGWKAGAGTVQARVDDQSLFKAPDRSTVTEFTTFELRSP